MIGPLSWRSSILRRWSSAPQGLNRRLRVDAGAQDTRRDSHGPKRRATSTPTSLLFPVFEDDNLSDEPDLDRASGGEYGRRAPAPRIHRQAFEQLFTPLGGDAMEAAPRIVGRRRRPEGPHHGAPPAGRDPRRPLCAPAAVREHRDRITSRRRHGARARAAGAGRGRGARQLRGDVIQDGRPAGRMARAGGAARRRRRR